MPASMRSRVDLPAPLWPTRPTRSPCLSDSVMSRSASMIGTRFSVPIRPPALPSTAFFNDRVLASKMGKSTEAFQTSILTMFGKPHSHPVGDAGTVVLHRQQGQAPADDGHSDAHDPAQRLDLLADQRRPHHLDQVIERIPVQHQLTE